MRIYNIVNNIVNIFCYPNGAESKAAQWRLRVLNLD